MTAYITLEQLKEALIKFYSTEPHKILNARRIQIIQKAETFRALLVAIIKSTGDDGEHVMDALLSILDEKAEKKDMYTLEFNQHQVNLLALFVNSSQNAEMLDKMIDDGDVSMDSYPNELARLQNLLPDWDGEEDVIPNGRFGI